MSSMCSMRFDVRTTRTMSHPRACALRAHRRRRTNRGAASSRRRQQWPPRRSCTASSRGRNHRVTIQGRTSSPATLPRNDPSERPRPTHDEVSHVVPKRISERSIARRVVVLPTVHAAAAARGETATTTSPLPPLSPRPPPVHHRRRLRSPPTQALVAVEQEQLLRDAGRAAEAVALHTETCEKLGEAAAMQHPHEHPHNERRASRAKHKRGSVFVIQRPRPSLAAAGEGGAVAEQNRTTALLDLTAAFSPEARGRGGAAHHDCRQPNAVEATRRITTVMRPCAVHV